MDGEHGKWKEKCLGYGKMYGFWRNVWVPEKCMSSRETYGFRIKMYRFQRNIWFLEKCMGSRDMYGFWKNVKILEECIDAGEM
jgi:hypothetical protein